MTEIPGMVERVARQMFEDFYKGYLMPQMSWEERPAVVREYWIRKTAIGIAAHEAALSDAGMVIVPREPTREMQDAGDAACLAGAIVMEDDGETITSTPGWIYYEMVAAHTADVFK